jgi:hypothetical protein
MIRHLERIRVARDPGAEVCIVNVDGNGQAAEGKCCAIVKWVQTQKDDSIGPGNLPHAGIFAFGRENEKVAAMLLVSLGVGGLSDPLARSAGRN